MASQFEKRKAKKEQVVITEVDPVFDKIAYDIFYDETEHKFVRVAIEYDLTLGVGRVKETKAIADSQPVAIYKIGVLMNRKIFNLPPNEEN